ncbi:Structural maintenance of chromosomes protein 6 [Nymphon striatum]|nr:Structural maintenance of chromosomes protein 6 [Nymphon striatum]
MKRVRSSVHDNEEAIPSKRSALDTSHSSTTQHVEETNVGILESVSVRNFMCHNRLSFKLSPNINFIIGRNGSGKSAVLAAVIVGLGGKAMLTNRGSSIKNFIKNGKSFTEISVKLKNQGPDAYKVEQYGNFIIVERRIFLDGSSQYKIRSESGQVISNKKEELTHILDQFNIQVDNPVSILNQETSKNFLNTKSAHEKYKFFLRATQLEQMKSDYALAEEQKKIARNLLDEKENMLPELKKEVEDWERCWRFHETLGDLRSKVDSLKQELVWAHVIEKERSLEKEYKVLSGTKSRLPKFELKVKEHKVKVDNSEKQLSENQSKLTETSNEVNEIQPKHNVAKSKLKLQKDQVSSKKLEIRRYVNEIRNLERERNNISDRIEELKKVALKDNSEEKKKRIENIDRLEKDKSELSAQLKTEELYFNQLKASITHKKEKIYSIRQEDRDLKMTIDQKRRTLLNLEGSQSNELKRYGEYMPELLQKIDEAHMKRKFVRKPIGPIGCHLKLKDPKWALAIETSLGALLFAFCCHCHEDARVLEHIMRNVLQNRRKPMIIVSAFQDQMYNVKQHAVQHSSEFSSVLRELQVESPVILNFLIDQRGVEMILLIPNNDLARKTMCDPRNVPVNCHEAFTTFGDHVYPAPSYRCEIKEELKGLQSKCQDVNAQLKTVSNECRNNENEYNKVMKVIEKNNQAVGQISMEISGLQSIEDPEPVDITVLEEEHQLRDKQLSEQTEMKNNEDKVYKEMCQNYQTTQEMYKELDNHLQVLLSDKYEPLKEETAHIQNSLAQAKLHLDHYESKKQEFLDELNDLNHEYNKKKSIDYVLKAEEICTKIYSRRTAQNIESEIVQITKQLSNKEKDYGNPEEVTKNYYETKEKYKLIKFEVVSRSNWISQLEKAMHERQHRYYRFRQLISMRVKYMFIASLDQANYSGKMEFNHKKQQLHIQVQPLKGIRDLQSDMKSLSGGERSFSLVSFVLALWDAMESPFRILDEFDVFMDMVNRRISMDMMLSSAHQKLSHQFIFLTPLDMTHLKPSNYVKIFKMLDPDRTQSTLPYEPSNRNRDEEEDT